MSEELPQSLILVFESYSREKFGLDVTESFLREFLEQLVDRKGMWSLVHENLLSRRQFVQLLCTHVYDLLRRESAVEPEHEEDFSPLENAAEAALFG